MMKKYYVLMIFILLLPAAYASYGVGFPIPQNINLLDGETGRFYFEIDTIQHGNEAICSYNLEGESPIIVEFDEPTIEVEAHKITKVFGSVSLQEDTEKGTYIQKFRVQCEDKESAGGAVAQGIYGGIPIKVTLAEERERPNEYVPPKPGKSILLSMLSNRLLLILAVILALMLIAYLIYLIRNKHLFHLQVYIGHHAKKGTEEKHVKKHLTAVGWEKHEIEPVMKKHYKKEKKP